MKKLRIDILTLFPKMFDGPFAESMVARAVKDGAVEIQVHDLRKWTKDKHKTADDHAYGGGKGMVLMVEPVYKALRTLKKSRSRVVLLTPQGEKYSQKKAKSLAKEDHLILLCGHYEGVDERIREHLVSEEISIGDYVMTGGEIPAMVLVDSVTRLLPGVLEKEAREEESFEKFLIEGKKKPLLEYPHYTRPEKFKGWPVPEILLSGNHAEIEKWRREKALARTKKRRPDLLEG